MNNAKQLCTMRCTGFTLIEILAVVFIIGIAASGVLVFIGQGGAEKSVDDAVERFVGISEYMSELSILSGEPVGLLLEPPDWQDNPLDSGWRYRWQKMESATGWKDIEEIDQVEFDTKMELAVFIDETPWEYENAPEERVPLVAFYPSGEVTPFEIEFTHEDLPGESETVYVDVWGSVVWKERQEQKEEQEDEQ